MVIWPLRTGGEDTKRQDCGSGEGAGSGGKSSPGAHLPNPPAHRVSRQRLESCSTLLSISGKKRCSYCSEHGSCTSSTTSARARPYADRTPLYLPRKRSSGQRYAGVTNLAAEAEIRRPYLCMKTVFMPRARAIEQACWPPAPPKHANTC